MSIAREASKSEWGVAAPPTWDQINAGSLQRIADATEKMAANYDAMRNERDRYKRYYELKQQESNHLRLSIRSLRGVITRLKVLGSNRQNWSPIKPVAAKNRRPSAGGRQP